MLRVLFCISCCGAPPTNRNNKQRKSLSEQANKAHASDATLEAGANSSSSAKSRDEKDQLLANQIQANNENYGTNKDKQDHDGAPLSTFAAAERQSNGAPVQHNSFTASTSSSLRAKLERAHALDSAPNQHSPSESSLPAELEAGSEQGATLDEIERRLRAAAGKSQEQLSFRDLDKSRSVSPPSSIDVDAFAEGQQQVSFDEASPSADQASQQMGQADAPTARANIPSTTKIGDYARIEYSPVEDLDSVTTYSRGGSSTKGYTDGSPSGQRTASGQQTEAEVEAEAEAEAERATFWSQSNRSSRRSSSQRAGGRESTSISIASQLSNEQSQQNLTNMLEQSASPTNLFATIGLPLGPPLKGGVSSLSLGDGARSETGGKTSPETPGAALTSASHDSLSDANDKPVQSTRRTATLPPNVQSSGGALVPAAESYENSVELNEAHLFAPIATGEPDSDPAPTGEPSSGPANEDTQSKSSTMNVDQRVGSPQSYATTTSGGGLTNPTPTPSELSQASQGKKKKLKAKAVLKKFKFGLKKSKSKEGSVEDDK